MKILLQAKTYALGLFALLHFGACQSSAPKAEEDKAPATEQNTQTSLPKEEASQNPSPNRTTQKVEIKGSLPAILASGSIFNQFKDLKDIGKESKQGKAYGSYEYYEENGKQVLHGQAIVGIAGMGFGSKTVANYREGQLEGESYHELATPNETRVYGTFKQGQLQTIQFYINDGGDCYQANPVNAQGKDFNQFYQQLNSIYRNDSFKATSCKD